MINSIIPLPYEICGNKDSDKLLVFMHGFPDTTEIWDPIIAPLVNDAYILNVSYPNFSDKETNPKGIDFEELIDRLKETIDQINDTGRKILIVSHDWGALFSYWFDLKYQNYVSEIIGLDIGLIQDITCWKVYYQLVLAIAFVCGCCLGNFMTRRMVKGFNHQTSWESRINSSWCYPYKNIWKKILSGARRKNKFPFIKAKLSCDIVYVWGTSKPVQFHNQAWLNMVHKNPNNEVHAVKSNHWIMIDQPDFLIDLIKRRLLNLKLNIINV